MGRRSRLALLVAITLGLGCSELPEGGIDAAPTDAAPTDAAPIDAAPPDAAHADAAPPDAAHADAAPPDAAHADAAPPDAAHADAAPLDAAHADAAPPDAAHADAAPLDAAHADAATSDAMPLDAMPLDAIPPDAARPDAARPDAEPPDAALPDAAPPAPACGDGILDDGERCDDGADNGQPGRCDDACEAVVPVIASDLVVHFPRLAADQADAHYRVLLVLVDVVGGLEDDPRTEVLEMYPPHLLGELFFNHPDGTSAFYREASYGRVSLSGTVVGWLGAPDEGVSADDLFTDRDQYFELAVPHVDFADYDVVYLVGKAHAGGRQTGWRFGNRITVSQGRFTVGIVFMLNSTVLGAVTDRRFGGTILPAKPWAHELGHTLGLGHATSIWCADTVFCPDYEVRPYGDPYSYMGSGEFASHPDVLQKLRLGWLAPAQVPELTPGVDAEVVVYPLTLDDDQIKGVRIPLAVPQADRDVLAVEYRAPLGFDGYLDRLHDPQFIDRFIEAPIDALGFQLRVSPTDAEGEFTSLLDLHPATPFNPERGIYTNGNPGKMADAFLNVGEAFTDPANGFTITNDGLTEDGGMILRIDWE